LTVKKLAYREISGVIRCVSGLRIGGSDDLLSIGGTDLTCVKHPVTLKPYLPGSSLKGKMRSELESRLDQFGGDHSNEPCNCGNCIVCAVFGMHKPRAHNLGPSRIIVRDAQLLEGGETELKSENIIDRATGAAKHPRKIERVVAGSTFTLRIGIQIWELDKNADYEDLKMARQTGENALVAFVLDGLKLVQRTGLGSGVSKGSGEIRFEELKLDGKPIPEDLW
jgi:CRISPR-associated protein Csm3